MNIIGTKIEGLFEINSESLKDERGSFTRLFCENDFSTIRPNLHFCQINLSCTNAAGSIRGLHFQTPPSAEAKLIRCIKGRAFDVAVDLRYGSPTFLQWHAVELNPNNNSMFIPEGFAHGFQALESDTELLYMHTMPWSKTDEHGLRFSDPRLKILWPLAVSHISDKDRNHALLDDNYQGIQL